jgi:hypothetical protein
VSRRRRPMRLSPDHVRIPGYKEPSLSLSCLLVASVQRDFVDDYAAWRTGACQGPLRMTAYEATSPHAPEPRDEGRTRDRSFLADVRAWRRRRRVAAGPWTSFSRPVAPSGSGR